MKKFLALLLALLLVLSLAACGQEAQNTDADKEKVENTQGTADKKDNKPASATEKTPGEQDGTVANPQDSSSGTTPTGEVDLSAFSLGVTEDGENVLVTVKNETDVGTVTCVMTFWYKDGKLFKETADYYVPDTETAGVLADELKQDATIDAGSVAISGNCVSCTMKESELAELQELTHDELVEAMSYAIEAMQ